MKPSLLSHVAQVALGSMLWLAVPILLLRDICAAFVNPATNRDQQ